MRLRNADATLPEHASYLYITQFIIPAVAYVATHFHFRIPTFFGGWHKAVEMPHFLTNWDTQASDVVFETIRAQCVFVSLRLCGYS